MEDLTQESIGVEEHLITEQHVVDANDAGLVEIGIAQLEAAAMQGIVEGMVDIVIEICAGGDDPVDKSCLDERHKARTA